jgi:peptide chain release factor 2
VPAAEQELRRLEKESARSGFWDDPQAAQETMKRLAEVREKVETWRGLEARVRELHELAELPGAEEDEALITDLKSEVEGLAARLDRLEFELSFSGPYDDRRAILAIHAGAGGVESMDWAQMLLRMYLRWAERRGYRADVLDLTPGEEAGLKSVTVEVAGPHAYGYLRSERGVHRLVRLSPFDAGHARHTSFALVEVMPEAQEGAEVVIDPEDLRIDVFRASGHGGQNVQKNATAVRITHLPTGIVVTCQNERSQHRNRTSAMKVLEARLLERELERRAEEQARLKGEHVAAGWGNQIRSYVLHPYKMVKDHRTGFETSEAAAVLEGEIDDLLTAYLKHTLGENGG